MKPTMTMTGEYASLSQPPQEASRPRQSIAAMALLSLVMLAIGGVLATALTVTKLGTPESKTLCININRSNDPTEDQSLSLSVSSSEQKSLRTVATTTTPAPPTTTEEKQSTPAPTAIRKPADGIPRVFLSLGCSGSSAVGDVLRKVLLPALGYPVMKVQNEFTKTYKNYKFKQIRPSISADIPDDVVLMEAIKFANQDALHQNETLMFKTSVYERADPLNQQLRDQMDARFAYMERDNLLDHLSCWIKDCFFTDGNKGDKHGWPVFAENGTQTELCFDRRQHPEVKIQIYMNPEEVIPYIKQLQLENEQRHQHYVQNYGPHVSKVQTTEDLFALEFTDDEDTFQLSVDAWTEFTSTFVIKPEGLDWITFQKQNRDTIAEALLPMRNTRHPYGPHRDDIYNFEEVQKVLAGTEYEKWVRY